MTAKFLEDYVKVNELIDEMNQKYPKARLVTELESLSGDIAIFKASLFLDDSDVVKCTGYGAENITREKKLEKAESVARGRCLRVLLGAEPTFEEMQGIAPSKDQAPSKKASTKKSIEKELDKAGIEFEDVSVSQTHIINNIKSFAMDVANENKANAANWYTQALGELDIPEAQLSIDNMKSVKNKLQDIATNLQKEGA
tara:strand:- start:2286 stop:2882 length:597 start_codon:yes stop_codon:yes gene_type:complete